MADLPIGDAVRLWREGRGMDKGDLARTSGLTRQYIWKIESGFVNPTMETLDSVAIGLGTELWRLMRFTQKLRNHMEAV